MRIVKEVKQKILLRWCLHGRLRRRALSHSHPLNEDRLLEMSRSRETLGSLILKRLVWNTSLLALFFIDTKANSCRLKKVGKSLSFDNSVFIDACNSRDSLALFWSEALGWKVVYKSNWIIIIEAVSNKRIPWSFWCCYCLAERTLKSDFWLDLDSPMSGGHRAWACIRDFYVLINQNEKQGGHDITSLSHVFLKNFAHKLGALDIGFTGSPFTWWNRRGWVINIQEMLDRAMVSPNWRILIPKAGVVHLTAAISDHVPILLHLFLDHPKTSIPFRFFEAWTQDPSYEQVIREAW